MRMPQLLPLKPAPITVAYLGYPFTMALPGVDYTISDRVVTPPEQYSSSSCFEERLAILPHTYMVANHRQSHASSILGAFSVEDARKWSLPHADNEVYLPVFVCSSDSLARDSGGRREGVITLLAVLLPRLCHAT